MKPITTPNTNLILTLPGCEDLPVCRRGEETGDSLPTVTSYWKPDEEDLAALNAGLPLVLSFLGSTHPPILVRIGDDA